MTLHFSPISLSKKFYMILIKWHYTLFTNWYISHILSKKIVFSPCDTFFLFSFCIHTLCYDNNLKFINCDGFAKTSQVLGSFMTKSINCHCVMGFISIVADPWRYLKTLRKFRQKSSQIKWFLVVYGDTHTSRLIYVMERSHARCIMCDPWLYCMHACTAHRLPAPR